MFLTPDKCLDTCNHIDITDVHIEVATEMEKKVAEQKGFNNPTTLPLNKRRDFIGCLAQYGIQDLFAGTGMEGGLELSPYFDQRLHSDHYDFTYRGTTYDVKGSPARKFKVVTRKTTFLVSDRQMKKRVGNYVFCMVDVENRLLHYPGYIGFDKFWELSSQAVGEWIKSPAHIIKTELLTPMEEMIV